MSCRFSTLGHNFIPMSYQYSSPSEVECQEHIGYWVYASLVVHVSRCLMCSYYECDGLQMDWLLHSIKERVHPANMLMIHLVVKE
jgi:hypothetical protein